MLKLWLPLLWLPQLNYSRNSFMQSTIHPCTEYCCHIWAGAPSCYLELLDRLQKQICRTVVPSHAASLEPLAHCRNVASLSLFYRYYFGRFFQNWLNWFHFSREVYLTLVTYDLSGFKSRINRHLLTVGPF